MGTLGRLSGQIRIHTRCNGQGMSRFYGKNGRKLPVARDRLDKLAGEFWHPRDEGIVPCLPLVGGYAIAVIRPTVVGNRIERSRSTKFAVWQIAQAMRPGVVRKKSHPVAQPRSEE